jgi:hypothetical protein
MGSSMRMMEEILDNSSDHCDTRQMADERVDYRDPGGRLRLLETPYRRCVDDALGVAREIYDRHTLPWTPGGEAAMRRWEIAHPRHRLGAYGYALEDYGSSVERVERAFGQIAVDWRGH